MDIPQIRENAFFRTPATLPRGRHQLARCEVLSAQRERIMIAATELLATVGYKEIGVREVTSRARVSRAAFYECFPDLDSAFHAAYDRFIGVLVTRLVEAIGDANTWDGTVHAVVSAYLSALQADVVVARAFQVEMDALGRPARDRRREALGLLAATLKDERDRAWPGAESVPLTAYVGAVYMVRQLASDALDAQPRPDLASLADATTHWVAHLLTLPGDRAGLREETR